MNFKRKFQIYDRVVCTNATLGLGDDVFLIDYLAGGHYSGGSHFCLQGVLNSVFNSNDFELAEKQGPSVGELVRVVDPAPTLVPGSIHTVESVQGAGRRIRVSGNDSLFLSKRFEVVPQATADVVESPATNGVNFRGDAVYFEESMLKPFQRVVNGQGEHFIVAPDALGGKDFAFIGRNRWVADFDSTDPEKVMKYVYEAPSSNMNMLDVVAKGRLIWKRQKSQKEIAMDKIGADMEALQKQLQDCQKQLQNLKTS